MADSACSATAYLSGVKTNIDTIGLDANVVYNDCSTQNNEANKVQSVFSWAQVECKQRSIEIVHFIEYFS